MKILLRAPFFVYLLALCSALVFASIWAVVDDRADLFAFHVLSGAVNPMVAVGGKLANAAPLIFEYLTYLFGVLSTALIALLVIFPSYRNERGRNIYTVLLFALLGLLQTLLIRGSDYILVSLVSFLVLYVGYRCVSDYRRRDTVVDPIPEPVNSAFSVAECLGLFGITLIAIFFRFYGLNQIVNYFEGEISPYMVGATSLHGMLFANIGWNGPWSPLGYFYYLPIYLTTSLFGSTILSVRLAAAIVSVLTVPLVYFLVRRLGSRGAALLAATFVALDPMQIGWGRSDVYPHGSTTWISILLCFALLNAYQTGKTRYMFYVALLMGFSFHQYPSGQLAFLIPIVYVIARVFDRAVGAPQLNWKYSLLLGGVVLWMIGLPLQYLLSLGEWHFPNLLQILGPRVSVMVDGESHPLIQRALFAGERTIQNLWELFLGIFVEVRKLHNQDFLPMLIDIKARTVLWVVAVGFAASLPFIWFSRRRGELIVVPIWILVGALPLILSDISYPKRGATIFPGIIALAAIGFSVLWRAVTQNLGRFGAYSLAIVSTFGFAAYSLVASYLWFSGERYRIGFPPEIAVANEIRDNLTPGTMVVPIFWNHYYQGKFSYLMIDSLRQAQHQPTLWLPYAENAFEPVISDPIKYGLQKLPTSMWYKWGGIDNRIPEIQNYKQWKKVLYLFQTQSWGREHLQIVEMLETARQHCRGAREWTREAVGPMLKVTFLECSVESPIVDSIER